MAHSHETGNPIVTANNLIADLLSAPLDPDWTVEKLAEQLLGAIAAQGSEEAQKFKIDADAIIDRQSRRLLRPLLACLATKSAAEAGIPAELYGGRFSFKRPGTEGTVWILGQFENRPGRVRLTLLRSSTPPESFVAMPEQPGNPKQVQDDPPKLPTRRCPDCKGSGIKSNSHRRFTSGGHDDRRCPRCDGQGTID